MSSKRDFFAFDVAEKFDATLTSVAKIASLYVLPFPSVVSPLKVSTAPKPIVLPLKGTPLFSSLTLERLDLPLQDLLRRLLELEEVASFPGVGL